MAKRYQKDIKVVLPKSNPFRDIAVYGAGEEMIKALGGELPDKGKQPDIVPTKNNPHYMKKSNKKGQSPRSILSPEQKMAMEFGWGGALGTVLGTGAALGLTALTGGAAAPLIPAIAGAGASIGGSIGSNIEQGIDKNKQSNQQFQPQYQQPLPQQMQFAKGGMLNKRGIPHRGTSEQMPYQSQMQSYPNLEFGNGEQMLANGGQLEDVEFAKGGIYIKPSKRGTFTAAATKHGKSVQAFASQVLANKENYSSAMVKKANFARNAAKWKHADGGFLQEPTEGVIERRNKNRSREPQEYATFEENFKHMYAQGGRMGAMGPMDVGNIYYADGGMLNHYTGERHENGGIPIGPNAEVEGGETSMKMGMGGEQDSTYIFSDRLQVPGKKHTFAEASKRIDNKYNRRTNDKLSNESKRLELNKLMESQEQERAGLVNSAYQTIAAYGGPIRKYARGGVDPVGRNSYYSGTDPVMNELMRFSAPTSDDNRAMMGYERAKSYLDFGAASKEAYKKADQEDLAFQNEIASQLDQETPSSPYINLNPSIKERIAAKKESRLNQKMKFNPNAYLDNQGNKPDLTAEEMRRDAANIGAVPLRGVSNIATPQRSEFSPQQEADMLKRDMANTKRMGMSPMTSKKITSVPSGYSSPDKLQNIAAPDFNEQAADTSGRFGTGEQWATGLGYGLQGASLLARQLQLSRNKLSPNKAFTMERQLLNADPQLREADISAAIANRNIRDLGASTSSGGAMAGYLAAQAGRTRSKADIMSDLQNRQAQIDMTTGQYNTQAQERAYDKDAADLAAQQTSQAQLFADMGKLGAGVTRDYLLGQSQEGLMGSMYNPYFRYNKQKGRNRYNTEYTGNI